MSTASQSTRVVIVGGGISGLSIAVRLAQAGLPVTLLEAAHLGFEATTRNQGWLHSGGWFARARPDLASMCHESLRQTIAFCPECIEADHEGMAWLISRPDTLGSDWTPAWTAAGIPWTEFDRAELFERLPGLAAAEVQRAYLLPDRSFRPQVLLERMVATAQNAGVEIRTDTRVVRLIVESKLVRGVVTGADEEVPARLVILATGVQGLKLWSDVTSPQPGCQSDYELVAAQTHLLAVEPEVSRLPFCFVDADGFNHLPHAPKSVFGTSRWLPVAASSDRAPVRAELGRLRGLVQRFFPELDLASRNVAEWSGTTVQAMHAEQVEPGAAPLPTVIDHARRSPSLENLLSVYPGRATLWPQLAEQTRRLVLDKLDQSYPQPVSPPWAR